jgi:hypothetical protein
LFLANIVIIKKFRNYDEFPYKVPAYLFVNSLPLSTLREKYTFYSKTTPPNSQEEQENVEYLNYIFIYVLIYFPTEEFNFFDDESLYGSTPGDSSLETTSSPGSYDFDLIADTSKFKSI